MDNQYSTTIYIPQADCDLNRHFTLGGILRTVQQMGMEQCNLQNVGTSYLLDFHAAWLLAKVSVEVYTELNDDMQLRVVTDPCKPHHAVYKRITSFYTQNGDLAAQADARWILADTETRKILRRPPEGMSLPYSSDVTDEHCVDIIKAKELSACGSVRAEYSRVDLNHHLNNTRYADILCDAMPATVWQNGGYAKKAVICYRNELPMHHEMALSIGRCDYHGKNGYYVLGQDDTTRYFEANILF